MGTKTFFWGLITMPKLLVGFHRVWRSLLFSFQRLAFNAEVVIAVVCFCNCFVGVAVSLVVTPCLHAVPSLAASIPALHLEPVHTEGQSRMLHRRAWRWHRISWRGLDSYKGHQMRQNILSLLSGCFITVCTKSQAFQVWSKCFHKYFLSLAAMVWSALFVIICHIWWNCY